jgi:hypothetical protein
MTLRDKIRAAFGKAAPSDVLGEPAVVPVMILPEARNLRRFSIAEMEVAMQRVWIDGRNSPRMDWPEVWSRATSAIALYRREQNRLARKSTRKPREQAAVSSTGTPNE